MQREGRLIYDNHYVAHAKIHLDNRKASNDPSSFACDLESPLEQLNGCRWTTSVDNR